MLNVVFYTLLIAFEQSNEMGDNFILLNWFFYALSLLFSYVPLLSRRIGSPDH